MNTPKEMKVLVEHIQFREKGLGEIVDITYETDEALIKVAWPNGEKSHHCAEELDFIVD